MVERILKYGQKEQLEIIGIIDIGVQIILLNTLANIHHHIMNVHSHVCGIMVMNIIQVQKNV